MPYGRCALADSPCWWRAVTTRSQVGGLSQNHQGKSIAGPLRMGRKWPPDKTFRLEIEALQVCTEGVGEDRKEIRGEDVAADDGEVGRRVLGIGLLDQVQHFEYVPPEAARPDDAVAADLFLGDAHDGEHGAVVTLEDVEELPHAWHARDDDVVAQEDAEGLVAHQGPRTENGVAEPERLLLPDIGHGGELGDGPDLRQLLRLASIL